jgi:hypothetical protein
MDDIKNIVKEIKSVKKQNNQYISYSEYICESLEKNIDYAEYVAERIHNSISYSEYVAEKMMTKYV